MLQQIGSARAKIHLIIHFHKISNSVCTFYSFRYSFFHIMCFHSSRQKAGVNGKSNENTSKRPASIKKEFIQSMVSLSSPHDPSGPIKCPILGPMLENEEIARPKASSKGSPIATMTNVESITSMKYTTKKTNTVRAICEVIVLWLMRTGSTAWGWSIFLNSAFVKRQTMSTRTHFKPPLVDPAQAPMMLTTVRMSHIVGCHVMKSSSVKPVVL